MKTTPLFLIIASLILALPSWSVGKEAHWNAPAKEAQRKNPVLADKASTERGKKLYKIHCAVCHGDGGRGDGPMGTGLSPKPSDLLHSKHHADGDVAWKIATGRGVMPGWKAKLTDHQIWDLVNFIKKGI